MLKLFIASFFSEITFNWGDYFILVLVMLWLSDIEQFKSSNLI